MKLLPMLIIVSGLFGCSERELQATHKGLEVAQFIINLPTKDMKPSRPIQTASCEHCHHAVVPPEGKDYSLEEQGLAVARTEEDLLLEMKIVKLQWSLQRLQRLKQQQVAE